MKINVLMLAFEDPEKIRVVEIPDDEVKLGAVAEALAGLVFHYGQNDFQPQLICSVSVGDVIDLGEQGLWVVVPVGFKQVTLQWLDEYRKLPRCDRSLHCYQLEEEDD